MRGNAYRGQVHINNGNVTYVNVVLNKKPSLFPLGAVSSMRAGNVRLFKLAHRAVTPPENIKQNNNFRAHKNIIIQKKL